MSWKNSGFMTQGGKIDCRGCFSLAHLIADLMDSLCYARKGQRLSLPFDEDDTTPIDGYGYWSRYEIERGQINRWDRYTCKYYNISAAENDLFRLAGNFFAGNPRCRFALSFNHPWYGEYFCDRVLPSFVKEMCGGLSSCMYGWNRFINQQKYSEGDVIKGVWVPVGWSPDVCEGGYWDWYSLCEYVGVDGKNFPEKNTRDYAGVLNKIYCMINILVYVLEERYFRRDPNIDYPVDYIPPGNTYTVKRLNIDPRWLDEGLATLATNPKNIN